MPQAEDPPAGAKVRVLFDATRMVARAGFGTPTGIDRVDLAYAQALGAAANRDLRLVVFDRLGPQLLNPQAAQHVIELAARNWRFSSPTPSPAFTDLRHFLEAPAGTERPRPAAGRAPSMNSHHLHRWRLALGRASGATALRRLYTGAENLPLVYVNTSHGHLFRPAAARWLAASRVASVFMVHDLIPIERPEFNRGTEPERHAARLRTVAAHASSIIVNSDATREALLKYLPATRQRVPPITALPLGIDECFGVREMGLETGPGRDLRPARPYFVALSTIEPRKNHLLLLEVWRRLIERDGEAAPRLLLIGRRGWENQTVFNILDRSSLLSRHVVECSGFNDREIATLLQNARALLSPSFAEGYGLPVAEALALGTPVIASDIPAHREVGGDKAEYLDPLDGTGWLRAICDHSGDSPRRNALVKRLSAYAPPRWETHFAAALDLIGQAAKPSATP